MAEQGEITGSLAHFQEAARRAGRFILAASLAANVILGGILFWRAKESAGLRESIAQAEGSRAAAISNAETARTNAARASAEAKIAIWRASAASGRMEASEARFGASGGLQDAIKAYQTEAGDLPISNAFGGLWIGPEAAPEALKRIGLYRGARAAQIEAMGALWTVSNACEASRAEAAAERRARDAADNLTALFRKKSDRAETIGRLQGGAFVGLTALGALAGGLAGKSPEAAILGGVMGAGAGIGVSWAIGRAGNSNQSKIVPILQLIR